MRVSELAPLEKLNLESPARYFKVDGGSGPFFVARFRRVCDNLRINMVDFRDKLE